MKTFSLGRNNIHKFVLDITTTCKTECESVTVVIRARIKHYVARKCCLCYLVNWMRQVYTKLSSYFM